MFWIGGKLNLGTLEEEPAVPFEVLGAIPATRLIFFDLR
jgi:hypothetical protein